MTTIASTNAQLTDADLVTASRSGDRRAFGQIIRKYQAMVSGLIYATCGDLHRSEDVAQETFISAWKSLSGLGMRQNWLDGSARSQGGVWPMRRERPRIKRFHSARRLRRVRSLPRGWITR